MFVCMPFIIIIIGITITTTTTTVVVAVVIIFFVHDTKPQSRRLNIVLRKV